MYAAQVSFQIVAGIVGFLSLEPGGRSGLRAFEAAEGVAAAAVDA
jgi:hypothetical protein